MDDEDVHSGSSISPTLNETQATVAPVPSDTEIPGFLGSTSFSEVWRASRPLSDTVWLEPSANFNKVLRTHAAYRLSPDHIKSGANVLRLLAEASNVRKSIEQFYHVSQIVIAPLVTMRHAIDSILKALKEEYTSEEQRQNLAEKIFAQTFIPMVVDENTTAQNFHELFTGVKLRWEIIGLIFVYFAMGYLIADSEQHIPSTERQRVSLEITHASNLCVSFCDRAESINDLLVWLVHANGILLTFQYGDTSHMAWRRVGDLASTVYALGLHQDPSNQPKLPFFLAELRRMAYCNAYSSDKALSTFFGRPPRISKRYSSCQPPLDLTDEEVIASDEARHYAITKLDAAGWNTKGAVHRTTWARVKLAINMIREETLELSLGPPSSDVEQRKRAQSILDQSKATYASIPPFARYSDEIWTSGLASNHCFPLLYYYLHKTYSEFLLLRILARHEGSTWDAVYESAQELLSAVLNISKHRDKIGGLSRDFAWVAIFYGLPSAALLAVELLRQQQTTNTPDVKLPRAEIIRNISVFISSLEWVAVPYDGNYDLCQGARQMLERILDAILDARPATSEPMSQPAPVDPVVWVDEFFGGGWMASGTFIDSIGVENAPAWDPLGNWPFEF